jgi:hypothetical protein
VEGDDPHGGHRQVCEGDMAGVGVSHGVGEAKLLCSKCLSPSLSLCRRGFQDLLKVRPPSLLTLCGCISSSVASLMSRSMYPVLAERRENYGSHRTVICTYVRRWPTVLV